MADEIEYKNGPKNNWRRSVWNAMKERLHVPARDAVVVYLAGESDLDRDVAVGKGFSPHNLIAIDRSATKVAALRRKGAIAVQGDFFDVIYSWRRPIDIVYGDFCSGLEWRLWGKITGLVFLPQVRQSVLTFNFLRGRDPSSNEARSLWNADRTGSAQTKHRGRMISTEFLNLCYWAAIGKLQLGAQGELIDETSESERSLLESKFMKCRLRLVEHCRPIEFSYRSPCGQSFDTATWIHPLRGMDTDGWKARDEVLRNVGAPAMRRKVAAALAHRTMRLN